MWCPRLILWIDMILIKFWDTVVVYWNHLENFFAAIQVKHWLDWESIFTSKYYNFALKVENLMKNKKKRLEADVSDKIIRTTRCTIIPISLEDRYDPWQVLWYLGCVLELSKRFFQVDWIRLVFSFWSLYEVLLLNSSQNPLQIPSEPFWTLKNEP